MKPARSSKWVVEAGKYRVYKLNAEKYLSVAFPKADDIVRAMEDELANILIKHKFTRVTTYGFDLLRAGWHEHSLNV